MKSFAANIRAQIETPDGKRNYNAGLFSRVAREYDAVTRAMSFGRDQVWKRRLVQALPSLAAPRCLDLACGTGDVTAALARRYPHGEILGLDLTDAMLAVARARHRHPNLQFQVGDMCRTGLDAGCADVVAGSYALRNAPVLDDALVEIRRLLRPGGCAAFLDFAKPPSAWRQAWQIRLLKFWGSFWGLVLHGRPEHAYIAESLRQFPDRRALREHFARHDFHLTHARSCFAGMLEILVLTCKPDGARDAAPAPICQA